jgi:tetratricopeptide (TPR) repeat protein
VFYYVSLRLLSLLDTTPSTRKTHALPVAAGLSALFFAIHPLRVESVAWATERRDVLSGLFFLLTILYYLKAVTGGEAGSGRRQRMVISLIFYGLSLLSKASGITLPLVLVVLDVYPLRRLEQNPKRWLGPESRKVWREKMPFLVFGLGAGMVALVAQHQAKAIRPLEQYDIASRIAQFLYGAAFYLWKTIYPFNLSPLYEVPLISDSWRWSFLLNGFGVLGITIALLVYRRHWPAIFASWIVYLVLLVPTSGIAQSGPQLVADRYSYFSCMVWAVAASGGIFRLWQLSWNRGVPRKLFDSVVVFVVLLVLMGFGALTWKQTQIWHNSERLWRHALALDQKSSFAHNNLGLAVADRGAFAEAIEEFGKAVEIDPAFVEAHTNLGIFLAKRGSREEAVSHLRQALGIDPTFTNAQNTLGNILADKGESDKAIEHFRQALQTNPKSALTYYNLARILAERGDLKEAIEAYRKAIEINSLDPDAHNNLGLLLARRGNLDQAIEQFHEALRVDPRYAKAYFNLGKIFVQQDRFEDAVQHFQHALRIEPAVVEIHENLARTLARQGKKQEALQHYEEALRLSKSRSNDGGGR